MGVDARSLFGGRGPFVLKASAASTSLGGLRMGGPRPGRTADGPIRRIRAVISRIPRGRVVTYGQVAELAGYPGAARLAVRALVSGSGLPWHRVVAAGGRIALPGPDGAEQRLRLTLEGVTFAAGRVRLEAHQWSPASAPFRPNRPQRRPRRRSAPRQEHGPVISGT
ncbi:MAG TPA: MGMT family protein [Thermoplasmata archaeon]|nr:MGMT family protein [Thermoplasmata archaeon]